MGAIAGCVGRPSDGIVAAMLDAVPHRGDAVSIISSGDATFGLRTTRTGDEEPAVFTTPLGALIGCVGAPVPAGPHPAVELAGRLEREDWDGLDGRFVFVKWEPEGRSLTVYRDAFGMRSLYWTQHDGAFWFASELKQLLVIPGLPRAIDPIAVHKYLTFSFVPGEATPLAGVRRLLPGHILTWRADDGHRVGVHQRPWFRLEENLTPIEQAAAAARTGALCRDAVAKRLEPQGRAGLYLSGGIDSSAVGAWLRDHGAAPTALTLDFGTASVEREEAGEVAEHLGLKLEVVPADPSAIMDQFDALIRGLDMPFGDAVTGPQWLLGRAARSLGLDVVWNGEGGDQLFGGWTSKPMVAAAVYGGLGTDEDDSPEARYLRSYHRFYGLESELYAPALEAAVTPGLRRSILRRFLGDDTRAQAFLNRVRLTDLSLKGLHNILPRAERIAAAHGLDVRMPFFDRALAEWSFTLPTALKLHGACEKYVLKLALQKTLPEDIVWRRKFGMSVPITDWVLGPMRPLVEELLSDESVRNRGLLQPAFVAALRSGKDVASETRRRRLGERLWALVMLEGWCRRFIDGRSAA